MRNFYKRPVHRKFYLLNYRIEAPTLRVIDGKGGQIGIIAKEEALRIAEEKEMDLVLIAPKANPPVAKVIDFKKFLYQEEKKQKEARKGIKKGVVKDLVISLFIAKADFDRIIGRAKEFLEDGNQVRINLTLRGREVVKKPMAFDLVKKFITGLGDVNVSKEPRLEGRVIRAVVARKK